MCKYIIVTLKDDDATNSGKVATALAVRNELADAFAYGDERVLGNGETVHIYERISTGKSVPSVAWEGRRRPGVGS